MILSARLRRLLMLLIAPALLAALPAGAVAASPVRGAPGPTAAPASSRAVAGALSQMTGLSPWQVKARDACPPLTASAVACLAQVLVTTNGALVHPRTPAARVATQATVVPAAAPATEPAGQSAPAPGTPTFLQQAYDLTWLSANRGSADTVAIVDSYDDPAAESDLAAFRIQYGLPACTTANGCFAKLNQDGQAAPLPASPPAGQDWNLEESLDLDAVSALCPNCHLILLEGDGSTASLQTAAATAQRLGAQQISMSFGFLYPGSIAEQWAFPNAASLAATGDSGYNDQLFYGQTEDQYPAAFGDVTAVGGTSLTAANNPRGFAESAWSLGSDAGMPGWGGGSGCATAQPKPVWQADTGCTGRSYADVAADADLDTGLDIYDSPDSGTYGSDWLVAGGTSLATPLTAAFEAITGVNGLTGQWAYTNSGVLNDIVSGSSGTCAQSIAYICDAGTGYDGPTGTGSISGGVTAGGPGIGGSYSTGTYANSALVDGGVYPNQLATTYWWEYGTSTSYGSQTAAQDIGSGATLAAVKDIVSGLQPGTTYHLRLVAQNSAGTAYGDDITLSTAAGSDSPPQSTAAPAVTGTAQQNQQLTATAGTWSAQSTITYQWQESQTASGPWAGVPGATSSTYTPTSADVGRYLRVLVTDQTAGGAATAASPATGQVLMSAPTNVTAPTVTGTLTDGDTLTATAGGWNPTGTVAYQWQRSTDGTTWQNITGATASTYTLSDADVADEVRVRVSETNSAGTTSAATAVGPVLAPAAPVSLGTPSIIFTTLQPGEAITANTGPWYPAGEFVTYRWERSPDGSSWQAIPDANGSGYTLSAADAGLYIHVVVTESSPGGSATAASASYGPVWSPPTSTPSPVSGPTLIPSPTPPANAPAQPKPSRLELLAVQRFGRTVAVTARVSAGKGTLTAQAVLGRRRVTLRARAVRGTVKFTATLLPGRWAVTVALRPAAGYAAPRPASRSVLIPRG